MVRHFHLVRREATDIRTAFPHLSRRSANAQWCCDPQQSFILTIWCPSQESTQVLLDPLIQGDDDRLSSLVRLTRPPSPLCSGHLGPLRCCTPPCAWSDGLCGPVCGSSRCGVFACAFRAWLLQVFLIFPLKHIAWCYAIREYCYGTVIVTNLFNNIVEVSYWKHNWRKICIWSFWNFATRIAVLFKKLCLFKNRVVEVNTLGLIFQEQRSFYCSLPLFPF